MVRKGRRHTGKRLEPDLPEAKDELHLPRYFGIIKGGGYGKAEGEGREIIPGPMPGASETPRTINVRQSGLPDSPFPGPAPELERVPLIVRAARYFASVLGVEPEKPVRMPVVPEMNYPALYTRYPIMKTVTKTTDAAGEISVTFSHLFKTIPGVVITVKDPDNVFGTVFSTTLTGFEVRCFKMDHDHGGIVDNGGAHTPTINADGYHAHNVQGTGSLSLDTNYGRLVLANYTDYETAHVHTNPQTGYEASHTHSNPNTGSAGSHGHSSPSCGSSNSNMQAVTSIGYGTSCTSGACVDAGTTYGHSMALAGHSHSIGAIASAGSHSHYIGATGAGSSHRHTMGNTGQQTGPGHRHLMSNDDLYDHYVYNVGLTLDLVASNYESPYHAHTGGNVVAHGHGVAADGRVLLKNTNITITYIAQEESS